MVFSLGFLIYLQLASQSSWILEISNLNSHRPVLKSFDLIDCWPIRICRDLFFIQERKGVAEKEGLVVAKVQSNYKLVNE